MPAVLKKAKFKIFVSENSIGCVVFWCVYTVHEFYLLKYKKSCKRIVTNHSSYCKDRPGADAYGELNKHFWKESFFSRTHRFGFTQVFQHDTELLSCSDQA